MNKSFLFVLFIFFSLFASFNCLTVPNITYDNAITKWEVNQGEDAAKVLESFPRYSLSPFLGKAPKEFDAKNQLYWQGIAFFAIPYILLGIFIPIIGCCLCCLRRCQKDHYSHLKIWTTKICLLFFILSIIVMCVMGFLGNSLLQKSVGNVTNEVTGLIKQAITNFTHINDLVKEIPEEYRDNLDLSLLDTLLTELNGVSNTTTKVQGYVNRSEVWRIVLLNLAYVIPLIGCLLGLIVIFTNFKILLTLCIITFSLSISFSIFSGALLAPSSVVLSDLCPVMDQEISQLTGSNLTDNFFGLCPSQQVVNSFLGDIYQFEDDIKQNITYLEKQDPRNQTLIDELYDVLYLLQNITSIVDTMVHCEAVQYAYGNTKNYLCVDMRNVAAFLSFLNLAFAIFLFSAKVTSIVASIRIGKNQVGEENVPLMTKSLY